MIPFIAIGKPPGPASHIGAQTATFLSGKGGQVLFAIALIIAIAFAIDSVIKGGSR